MERLREILEQDQLNDEEINEETNNEEIDNYEIEVLSFKLEDAIKQAAEYFKTSIMNLEYEILEHGKSGFLGFGKKPYKILVRLSQSARISSELLGLSEDSSIDLKNIPLDEDGKFKVQMRSSGLMLKVLAPKGKGKPVRFDDIKNAILEKDIKEFDEATVKKEINNPSEEWVVIGKYTPSPYDSKFQVQISPDEMKAIITITKPEKYGRVPDIQEIINYLREKKVVYGIKEDVIRDTIENETFNVPVIIAEGDYPKDGKDAEIKYYFKTDEDKVNYAISDDGTIDFHKLDIIKSVVVGQVLAAKTPAEKGKAGRTITGKILPAKDGKDKLLLNGNNTHISPDGLQIIADINGQVVFKNGKVNVEPVLEISGDVDLNVGDINFPGNVVIFGNVNDTFKVYSGANIEIKGNIGKSNVVAEGNIIVRQGIQGKDEAKIICGGDLYAKFIERANVQVEGYIIVTEVILHSHVSSKNKIFCLGGKRSQIAGGVVRALYEINSKFLGAEAYTETLVEVGTDPTIEDKLLEMIKRKEEINKELPDITKQLSNLSYFLARGSLPPDKEAQFNELTVKNNELKNELASIEEEIIKLQTYLDELGKGAKISASKTVYPGVKIKIKNSVLPVKSEFKFVTFYKEGPDIKISPYEKSKEIDDKLKSLTNTKQKQAK